VLIPRPSPGVGGPGFQLTEALERLSCHDEYEYEYECDGKTMKYFDIIYMQALCCSFLGKLYLKDCFFDIHFAIPNVRII